MKKNKKNKFTGRFAKGVLIVLVCGAFLWLSFKGMSSFLSTASYFRVKRVTFIGLDDEVVAQQISKQLMYDNIFSIDIAKIARNLKLTHSSFYGVDIIRSLPDELIVKVIRRKPVAQIQQRGFFLVDSEGVIVSDELKRPQNGYIIIEGLKNISGLSFGKRIASSEFASALQLAGILLDRKENLFALLPNDFDGVPMRIEVILYPRLYVSVKSLELRFHSDSFHTQLLSLLDVLPSLEKKIKKVKYIDLRWGDPAVSF